MLKKNITYFDYDGVERKEDHYFNLNKAELMVMMTKYPGGMQKMLERVLNDQDAQRAMSVFEDLIKRSYGIKSDDGKRFMKSDAISEAFMQTEAYSELFMELLTNNAAADAFVRGIIPADLAQQIAARG